jgi:hypothetical protein
MLSSRSFHIIFPLHDHSPPVSEQELPVQYQRLPGPPGPSISTPCPRLVTHHAVPHRAAMFTSGDNHPDTADSEAEAVGKSETRAGLPVPGLSMSRRLISNRVKEFVGQIR